MGSSEDEMSSVYEEVVVDEWAAARANAFGLSGAISSNAAEPGDNQIPPEPHEGTAGQRESRGSQEPQEVLPPNLAPHQESLSAYVVMERIDYADDVIVVDEDDANFIPNENPEVVAVPAESAVTPSSTRKRKRPHSKTPPKKLNISEEDDDGSTCMICLDHWEMSGTHRPACLKCGHIFGHSCIKRWISECAPGLKCCPTCKAKATNRDIRFLYAKRISAVDNTEICRLRELLVEERGRNMRLVDDINIHRSELTVLKNVILKLTKDYEILRNRGTIEESESKLTVNYTLFMEKNIEICKKPGCRVMIFSKNSSNLIVSQKSTQNLFSGYGVRFIDTTSFKPTHFLHMSTNSVRDLGLNSTEDLLISATMDKSAKLFCVRDRTVVSVFTPSDKALWACAIDNKEFSNYLYLGSQHGSTYLYDIRYPTNVVKEFQNAGDFSPVINICPVPASTTFPLGGFLVCKLQSLWFYEQTSPHEFSSVQLSVEGPFLSMSYDQNTNHLLVATRPNSNYIYSRYIVANLVKVNGITILDTSLASFPGARIAPVMSRCTQISFQDNVLVAAYLQDARHLSVWNLREQNRIQSFPISDIVFDTCPIYQKDKVFLAALTETKCRIYRITQIE